MFTSLNPPRNTLAAPSSFFALDFVLPDTERPSRDDPQITDSLAGPGTGLLVHENMTSRHLYSCFDTLGKGHFQSADELCDNGVWIGYLAEESRDTRYRQLPSFRELENNHRVQNLPAPKPLHGSSCGDREAVCRGCFGNESTILQLREIRFGSHEKVLIMPLKGADNAGLFCIMLPQPMDRSIKALEKLRPYEHAFERGGTKPFTNDYMLLAIRDRTKDSGLLHMTRALLDPAELSRITDRPGRRRSDSGPSNGASLAPTVEKIPQKGRPKKVVKRKRQQASDDDFEPQGATKKNKMRPLTSPRMSASIFQLSDGDMAEPLRVPNARSSTSRVRVQEQTPISPTDVPRPSPIRTPAPKTVGSSQFTDEQALHIHFHWKVDYEGLKYDFMRTLGATKTFSGLLRAFREDAEYFPPATQQMQSKLWVLARRMGDGDAIVISLNDRDFELSFNDRLRTLVENEAWKEDPGAVAKIELKAMMPSSGV